MIIDQANENCKIVLVGTKSDLKREVLYDEALEYMKNNKINLFFETSAKTELNIQKVFNELARDIFVNGLKNKIINDEQKQIENLSKKNYKNNNGCC